MGIEKKLNLIMVENIDLILKLKLILLNFINNNILIIKID